MSYEETLNKMMKEFWEIFVPNPDAGLHSLGACPSCDGAKQKWNRTSKMMENCENCKGSGKS